MGQDREATFKQLNEIIARGDIPHLLLKNEKYVILSDLHLGDGKKADDLHYNQQALLDALEKYYNDGFKLILLGDIEELWQFDLKKIVAYYADTVYKAIKNFGNERVIRVYGNHDFEWCSLPDPTKGIQPEKRNASEAIVLVDDFGRNKFLLVHGHQGNIESDKASWSSRFWVRCFKVVEPIAKYLGITAHLPALRSQITKGYDKIFYDWAKGKGISIICGHSHRAIFAARSYFQRCKEKMAALEEQLNLSVDDQIATDKIKSEIGKLKKEIKKEKQRNFDIKELDLPGQIVPCYYNTGCALFSDGITGIEIEGGEIRLVKWERDRSADPNYLIYQKGRFQ